MKGFEEEDVVESIEGSRNCEVEVFSEDRKPARILVIWRREEESVG